MKARVNRLFQNTAFRYFFGIAVVGSAFALRLWLIPWTGTGAPFVLFFAAVVVTSLFAGVGPAVVAVLLSMPLAAYTFVTGAGYSTAQASFQALLFALDGIIVIYLTFLTNKAVRSLQHANRQVRESEEKYRALFDSIDEGFCVIEVLFDDADNAVDYRFLEVNPAFEKQSGISNAVGRRMREIAPALEEHWFQIFGQIALTGEARRFENPAVALGRFYDVYAFRLGRPDERHVAVLFNDITARKRFEKERQFLAEAGAVLAASIDYEQTLATVAHLVVRDFADWCIVEIVDERQQILRLKVVGGDPSKADVCTRLEHIRLDRDRPYLVRPVFETKQPLLIEHVTLEHLESMTQGPEHLQALRAMNPTSVMALPLLRHERLLGALAFISSTASRRYGLSDLRLAEALAERAAVAMENARLYRASIHATELRDQVLGVVAHDLRNPLSAILMQTSALKRQGREFESSKPLEVIHRAASRMNRLIQDLLDVALMEAGHLPIERARLSAGELIAEAADMQGPLAASSSLELRVDVDPDVAEVWADRNRLLQVFENLIGNAIKFTPAGGRVTVGATSRDEEVVFRVADTGHGIPPEQLPRVFDRFWQATSTGRLGAGLGLPITKGIVEAHGGRIWVESTAGRGSTFFFTMPRAVASAGRLSDHRRPGRAA